MKFEKKFQSTEIGLIPKDWKLKELKDILHERGYIRGPFGSSLKRPELKSEGIPVYEQQHVIDNHRNFRFFIDDNKFKKLARFAVKHNDIVISCSGTIGKISIIKKNDPKGIISQALLILRPDNSKILPKFLQYFLYSKIGHDSILSVSSGTVQVNIAKRGIIEAIKIALPAIQEQHTIVKNLSVLDAEIELLQKQNDILENLTRTIFRSWFVDFDGQTQFVDSVLGEIPKEWKVRKFSEIIEIYSGGTPKTSIPEYWNGGVKWVSVVDTKQQPYIIETEKTISRLGESKSNAKILPSETIVITARGTVGNCSLMSKPMTINQSCYGLTGKNGIGQIFLFYLLKTNLKSFLTNVHGSVFDTITRTTFELVDAIVPTIQLIDEFEKISRPFYNNILKNQFKINLLSKIRDFLLPKLMSGQIRV